MKPSQPVQDTFTLLAGGIIRRSPRPGEEFPAIEAVPEEKRVRRNAAARMLSGPLNVWLWCVRLYDAVRARYA